MSRTHVMAAGLGFSLPFCPVLDSNLRFTLWSPVAPDLHHPKLQTVKNRFSCWFFLHKSCDSLQMGHQGSCGSPGPVTVARRVWVQDWLDLAPQLHPWSKEQGSFIGGGDWLLKENEGYYYPKKDFLLSQRKKKILLKMVWTPQPRVHY